MKKLLVLFLALLLCLSFVACGDKTPAPASSSKPSLADLAGNNTPNKNVTDTSKAASDVADFEPVTFAGEQFELTVVGAEPFKDMDDKDAVRIYYDFTNTSADTLCAWDVLVFEAEQEGYTQDSTWANSADDVSEYGNDGLRIRPGITIRCITEYSMKADGGAYNFTFIDWDTDEEFTITLDPANLPGRPAADLDLPVVSDPQWALDLEDGGEDAEGNYFYIDTAELTTGYEGEELVRIYFEFTNGTEETSSFWWETSTFVFQDGMQLEQAWAEEEVPEDELYDEDVAPGETVRVSMCFLLNQGSESPIEVELGDSWDEREFWQGCRFNFD